MMRLISYGDDLEPGCYLPHSRFRHAVNFVCGEKMISCVDESIGPGPVNIEIDGTALELIQNLTVAEDKIIINGVLSELDSANIYRSHLALTSPVDLDRVSANLDYFKTFLCRVSDPMSLAFIIDPGREAYFVFATEKEFVRRFKTGVRIFFSDDFIAGVRLLRGLGFGLTPSGDDFISGALAGLYISQVILQKNNSAKIEQIYQSARGDNLLVNSFFRCSRQGKMTQKAKKLMLAIVYGEKSEIITRADDLVSIGATSGADWGVGLYLTMLSEIGKAG